jgi:hypothetical protein
MTPAAYAWTLVLDALEDAIDVDELPAADRGALAWFHDQAGRHLGIAPLRLDSPTVSSLAAVPWRAPARRRPLTAHQAAKTAAQGPGGISGFGDDISAPTWIKLYKLGLPLIADVERADQADELAAMKGIGPRVLKQIRTALAKHREWTSLAEAATNQ